MKPNIRANWSERGFLQKHQFRILIRFNFGLSFWDRLHAVPLQITFDTTILQLLKVR
jgi:hypothetical protein